MRVGVLGDLHRPLVLLVRPVAELLLPGVLLGLDGLHALGGVLACRHVAVGEPQVQRLACRLGVAADADRDLLDEAQHAMVGVDLDDLGVLGPVVEAVLRQRAERPKPRAERQHHVGLGDDLHGRLRALVAERAAPQRMVGGEAVVVQVAVDDGRLQELGQRLRLLDAARHDRRRRRRRSPGTWPRSAVWRPRPGSLRRRGRGRCSAGAGSGSRPRRRSSRAGC